MKYQRMDEILGPHFVSDYLNGKIEFEELSTVPDIFSNIYHCLNEEYVFTNALKGDSCLIIPEARTLCERLSNVRSLTRLPTLYVDPRINLVNLDLLGGGGIIFEDDGSFEQHYRKIGRKMSQDKSASIFIVKMTEWDNKTLQEALIKNGKDYCVALPKIEDDRLMLSYRDPHRWL